MAELIASGTTESASADFTLAAGESATIFLKDAAGSAVSPLSFAEVQIKSADAQYFTVDTLSIARPALVLTAVGTFRVLRMANSAAFGVDKS